MVSVAVSAMIILPKPEDCGIGRSDDHYNLAPPSQCGWFWHTKELRTKDSNWEIQKRAERWKRGVGEQLMHVNLCSKCGKDYVLVPWELTKEVEEETGNKKGDKDERSSLDSFKTVVTSLFRANGLWRSVVQWPESTATTVIGQLLLFRSGGWTAAPIKISDRLNPICNGWVKTSMDSGTIWYLRCFWFDCISLRGQLPVKRCELSATV